MMIASRSRASSRSRRAAHDDRAAAGLIGAADAGAAEDDAAGREVRARHDLHQLVDGDRRIVDQRDPGVDHLAEIVRRDVGRHADRDAARAVDQQVRETRRQHRRLALGAVVVRAGNRRCPCRGPRAAHGRLGQARPRCSAWPPADRRRPSRNCPGRRSAAGASTSPAPCAPARRRSPGRRAGDTYPSRRRRRGPTCGTACSASWPFSFIE